MSLRHARLSDAPDLHRVYGNADAMRYWSGPPDATLAETEQRVDGFVAEPPPFLYRVIERDGRAIGTLGIHQDTEIGFILHPDHWRQGILREAMTLYVPWFFDIIGASRMTADVDPRNTTSMSALKALGFKQTGFEKNTFCVDGDWSDSAYFELKHTR